MEYPLITAVMCTYRRFKCVERATNCFLQQTYPNKELIIYNTDTRHPYDTTIYESWNVRVFNNNTDYETKKDYTNVGAIRRDALTHAKGEYVVTWDDDDIWLPFFMEQAMDKMRVTGLPSYKPEKSFFYSGNHLRLVKNTLEASIVARTEKVREYGYLLDTGREGLGWYTKMRDNRELDENDPVYLPAYCFNWQDGAEMNAPHKQSGDIDNPNNFSIHKAKSTDSVLGRQITKFSKEYVHSFYLSDYYEWLFNHKDTFNDELVEKYLYR